MRRASSKKRKINPDSKYGNQTVAKFINMIMRCGKKNLAQRLVYSSFDIIKEKTKKDPLDIFDLALKNVGPLLEVKGRRIGGANYQIPHQVRGPRRDYLAMKWIVDAAKSHKGKSMDQKLALELISASNKEGSAVKKRNDVHRMADANKAFAHYAM